MHFLDIHPHFDYDELTYFATSRPQRSQIINAHIIRVLSVASVFYLQDIDDT